MELDLPTQETVAAAGEAVRELSEAARDHRPTSIELRVDGAATRSVTVPLDAFELIVEILSHLANGHGVTILPVEAELTTRQAAEILNVSRPHLTKLVDAGEIPHHRVGTHRRIRLEDLMAYKRRRDEARQAALTELTHEAQEMGLEY